MKETCKRNLLRLKQLVAQLSEAEFSAPVQSLSQASLGQHVRHVLEMYIGLIRGLKIGELCYDCRDRDKLWETMPGEASNAIEYIIEEIAAMEEAEICLKVNYESSGSSKFLKTTTFRELAYNLEHAIHHEALIKVGLRELGKMHLVDGHFGVAYSTIQYRQADK